MAEVAKVAGVVVQQEVGNARRRAAKFVDKRIAEELERCADELQDADKFVTREVQYLRDRAAELWRKEKA